MIRRNPATNVGGLKPAGTEPPPDTIGGWRPPYGSGAIAYYGNRRAGETRENGTAHQYGAALWLDRRVSTAYRFAERP